ncbi:MAG: UDP-4-amino-4,6-dideoxy-N-acetyl-beta-L-altrosamine transaminase [Chlamydiae bacterium]|nr:UDP-4-amino-4,6-dideoxy-N-acetyl-beta-L-altrosamine transaminase [Chlamydiota bacterium]
MNFIPYTQQTLNLDDVQAVLKSFGSSLITRGPLVEEFEKKCSKFCKAKYAVAFNSGTNALTAAGYAAQLNEDDTVVSSPITFVGTVAGALQKTRNFKLADIDLKTGSPNFKTLSKPKNGRVFLFPVHFSGIAKTIKKPFKECVIIEDGCQAFGSKYLDGAPVGSCPNSDMTVFSFHPAKTICMGEGGVVTTNSKAYYERLKLFRNNGIVKEEHENPWMYQVKDLTTNCNVTDFQAALGLSQLERIDHLISERKKRVLQYRERLKNLNYISFLEAKYDDYSAHNLLPVLIDFEKIGISRKELMNKLKESGIGTQVHFIPLYHHEYFQKHFQINITTFSNTEIYYSKALSLPLFSHLTEDKVDEICNTLIKLTENIQLFN